jgi:hypothetical protein
MDQVFISDLIARGIIEVNDWEREKPGPVLKVRGSRDCAVKRGPCAKLSRNQTCLRWGSYIPTAKNIAYRLLIQRTLKTGDTQPLA